MPRRAPLQEVPARPEPRGRDAFGQRRRRAASGRRPARSRAGTGRTADPSVPPPSPTTRFSPWWSGLPRIDVRRQRRPGRPAPQPADDRAGAGPERVGPAPCRRARPRPAMLPVRAIVPAMPWSFDSWCMARSRANRSARAGQARAAARRPACPGTAVAIGSNGPRYSSGASGFMSNVSRWLGPPQSQSTITLFACGRESCPAFALMATRSARDSPIAPRPPTWRKALRESPPHVRPRIRPRLNMMRSLRRGRACMPPAAPGPIREARPARVPPCIEYRIGKPNAIARSHPRDPPDAPSSPLRPRSRSLTEARPAARSPHMDRAGSTRFGFVSPEEAPALPKGSDPVSGQDPPL